MKRIYSVVLAATLLLVGAPLLLTACDSGETTGSIDQLLIDARIARQAGDIDQAITLLESAMNIEPDHAQVRVELSSAYLDRDDIDLLDVDQVALFLASFADNAGEPSGSPITNLGGSCQYAGDPDAQPFEPGDYQGYVDLHANRDVIDQVLSLLNGNDPSNFDLSIMPDELRALSLCEGIVDGQIVYDREAALSSMRALGLNDEQIATALAVNAVARFFEAYFFIVEDIPQQTNWYRVAGQGGDYIGVCADDLEALRQQVQVAVQNLGEAVTSLDLRDHVLGGSIPSQELVQHVLDAYEAIEGDLGPLCDGGQ